MKENHVMNAPANRSSLMTVLSWAVRLAAVALFLWPGAIPKLISDPYAIQTFETLGVEPWGRYFTAVAELTAAVLLLLPRTAAWGGVFGAMVMVGAIGSHLTKLGVVPEYVIDGETVQNPLLFWLAVVLLALCAATVVLHRRQLPIINGRSSTTRET